MRKAKIKSYQDGKYEFSEDVTFWRWTDKGQAVIEKASGYCGLIDADDIWLGEYLKPVKRRYN